MTNRVQIRTKLYPANYIYAHHMGSGMWVSDAVEAWEDRDGGRQVYLSAEQHPGLTLAQLEAKARALLVAR